MESRSSERSPITILGSGSLGGKAKGLSLISETLESFSNSKEFDPIKVGIPPMIVLKTGCFEAFMECNNLWDFVKTEHPDAFTTARFLKSELPPTIVGPLYAYITSCRTPLAVRSSSLFEDQLEIPLAGVYGTKIIPNNQTGVESRFQKLAEAIKFVYASLYFRAAHEYITGTGLDHSSERMAVIIQEVVGEPHGERFYPNVSGVARSYHFYPIGKATPKDGVVSLAIGLGKTIVDGGSCWTYSPRYPAAPPPYGSISQLLDSGQHHFWALHLHSEHRYDPSRENEFLRLYPIKSAEQDRTHLDLVSTWDPRNDRLLEGGWSQGPRLVDFAPILKSEILPLNRLVRRLLSVCEEQLDGEVEIEFAATWDEAKSSIFFGFLQVRPMNVTTSFLDLTPHEGAPMLASSAMVMGNGSSAPILDIVYVKPEGFSRLLTRRMADEIALINHALHTEGRPMVLIGFGRWGSSDPSLGIPVRWSQISQARVILEASTEDMNPDMSQGSHFFHNLCALGVHYYSMGRGATLDWDFLQSCETITETEHVRHVRASKPMMSLVDGRRHKGIVTR